MAKWDVAVFNPDGSYRALLTPDDPVHELRWAIRGDGDCLEGLITGVRLDLRPRDIVAIRSVEDADEPDTDSVIRYWGWVVTAGDARSPEVTQTRLIGGSQRLREIVNQRLAVPAGDVGVMARNALDQTPSFVGTGLPPGLVAYEESGHAWRFPTQGFQLGVRYPRLEYLSDTLEALAAAVPAFIAPPGGYTIDGVTYNEDDPVPATTWGTMAVATHDLPAQPGGRIYLRRASGTLQLHEVNDELWVEFEPVSADVIVDNVIAVVADHPSDGVTEARSGMINAESAYVPLAVTVLNQFGQQYGAWARIEVPTLDAFEASAWTAPPHIATGVLNVNNAYDANLASYARNIAGPGMNLWRDAQAQTRAARITYSSHRDINVRVWLRPGGFVITGGEVIYDWRLAATDGEQRQVVLLAPTVEGASTGRVTVALQVDTFPETMQADEVRIYDITALRLNEEVLTRIATSQLKAPAAVAGRVTIPNRIVTAEPFVELTLEDATTIEAAAATYEYGITSTEGFSTTVRLNQELTADLTSERELLNRRLRGSPNWGGSP